MEAVNYFDRYRPVNESISQKKGLFSLLRFLNMYILSLVLIFEPGDDSYDINKFWSILRLVILIKTRLMLSANSPPYGPCPYEPSVK